MSSIFGGLKQRVCLNGWVHHLVGADLRLCFQPRVHSIVHLSVAPLRTMVEILSCDFGLADVSSVKTAPFTCTFAGLAFMASSADLVPEAKWSPGRFEDHAQTEP